MGFNHPFIDGEEGLTAQQLDGMIDRLWSQEPTGVETHLSDAQINYLHDTRFNNEAEHIEE